MALMIGENLLEEKDSERGLVITCNSCAKNGLGRIAMKYNHTDGPFKKGRSYDTYTCPTPGCGQTAVANYDNGVLIGVGQKLKN